MRAAAVILCVILLIGSVASPLAATGEPTPPTLSAEAAVLIEAESGQVLLEKNADRPMGMASTTKIMTALCALEAWEEPERIITVSPEAVGVEGSSLYLRGGERMPLLHLLYALLLASANDAAAAIAIGIDGSIEGFAARMNEKAASLGLRQTHFENPHGLDASGHQTTARELAILTAHALQNETFRTIVSTKQFSIEVGGSYRTLINHNRLLRTDARVYGVKTGYTRACGRCLVSAARNEEGCEVIAVTLRARDDWQDHEAMYVYGFSLLTRLTLAEPGGISLSVPVSGGNASSVTVTNRTALARTLRTGDTSVEMRCELPRFLFAPVLRGQVVGEAIFVKDGVEIGRLTLTASESVDAKPPKQGFFARILAWIRSLFGM